MIGSTNSSSSGHVLSSARWLDTHFEACREEYVRLLDAVPLQGGMAVLDAGCGGGSYIEVLRERIGPTGRLIGLDFDPENVAGVHQWFAGRSDGEIAASIAALPFEDESFDAVWCANTMQYFDDRDLPGVLSEIGRVVRSGGLVAVKDVDMTGFRVWPAPPLLGLHLAQAAIGGPEVAPQSIGSLRGRDLRRHLEASGLVNVEQVSILIERWGPLEGSDARFWSEWLPYLAAVAEESGVPATDLEVWHQVSTSAGARTFVSRPEFYGCELQVVACGRVP